MGGRNFRGRTELRVKNGRVRKKKVGAVGRDNAPRPNKPKANKINE